MRPRLIVAAVIVAIAAGLPRWTEADETWQVVRNVRLYSQSSTLSQPIRTLHKPELVTQLDSKREGDYIQVRTPAGELGWVYVRSLVAMSPSAQPLTGAPALALGPLETGEMRVHYIDVGQGLATLLEFQCGAILIDTGGEKNDEFDSTTRLLTYLTDFFARRADLQNTLDLVVLSHPHIDHTRGVNAVLDHFTVRNAVDNGEAGGSGAAQQAALEDYTQQNSDVGFEAVHLDDISRTTGRTSAVIDPIDCQDGDPAIHVLWGLVSTDPGWGKAAFGNPNNHSVVVRVDYGKASFLFPGDLEDVAIHDLVKRYAGTHLLDVDVYEAGHHGSKNGTTPELVSAMSPKLAVISMGPSTRELMWTAWKYGHPNKGIVQEIASGVTGTRPAVREPVGTAATKFEPLDVNSAIYATGWDGTLIVTAKLDGRIKVTPSIPSTTVAGLNP
jgi:competence protein ComEC